MAGGWNVGPALANAKDVGTNLTTSALTLIQSGGTAYTKGGWVQLVASTTVDTAWILIQCSGNSGGGYAYSYDIAVGSSGNEMVVVPNLTSNNYNPNQSTFFFPLSIPAGTRIAARCSSDNASNNGSIKLTLFDDNAGPGSSGSSIDTYGYVSGSNTGLAVDPGATINTKGAYQQLTASLTSDLAGFFLSFDTGGLTTGSAGVAETILDVAIGASGSEIVILPNFVVVELSFSGSVTHWPESSPYFPIQIRAGTRVAMRAQAETNVSPDRKLGVTFYGVRR